MKMVNTTYNSPGDMNNKLQSLKIKIYRNLSRYYDEMKIRIF